MNIPTANSNTPGWFGLRLPATKKILEEMTSDERSELEEEAKDYQVNGLPPEVQRK